MKKLLIVLLTLVLLATVGYFSVYAEDEFVIDSSGTLVEYNGNGGNVVIPDNVGAIGDRVFYQTPITSLTIPDSVTHIGDHSFYGCGLKTLILPDSVTDIEAYAFAENDISFADFPESLKTIGDHAFDHNELRAVTIPGSVKYIGNWAFNNNKLTSFFMKEGVEEIGNYIFGSDYIYGYTHANNIRYLVVPRSMKYGMLNDLCWSADYTGIYRNSPMDDYVKETGDTENDDFYYIDFSYDYVYGQNRYTTSFKAADYLKKLNNNASFTGVVIAFGGNFPDALSGSFLANKNNVPILLIDQKRASDVQQYIRKNVKRGGNVYVLGGTGVIPDSWLGSLSNRYSVKRLSGSNRYGTNIEILKAADYNGGDILVCTGKNYADSLSASAIDKPVLLVGGALNTDQKKYLDGLRGKGLRFHIVGGNGAVSDALVNELRGYGTVVDRYSGSNRYETSVLLAEAFYTSPKTAVLSYGGNFPDGLCAGPIAHKLGVPLLLTSNSKSNYEFTSEYTNNMKMKRGVILGSPSLVGENVVWNLLGFKY